MDNLKFRVHEMIKTETGFYHLQTCVGAFCIMQYAVDFAEKMMNNTKSKREFIVCGPDYD